MIGIFPVTYVEIIPNESVGSLSRNNRTKEPATSAEGKGKAKFNFQAQTPMELSLIKGNFFRENAGIFKKTDRIPKNDCFSLTVY